MYEYLEGIVTIKNLTYVALDVNGIGFKIYISIKSYEQLANIGEKDRLYIHTVVKEDDISFFGFKTELEREIFLNCISINGIGAKKSLAILSTFNFEELAAIIKTKNAKELSKVPGIGIKKAEKIIIDLSDKIDKLNIKSLGTSEDIMELYSKKEDLKLALESLGYEKLDVSDVLDDETIKSHNMQELIKLALLNISRKKK